MEQWGSLRGEGGAAFLLPCTESRDRDACLQSRPKNSCMLNREAAQSVAEREHPRIW